MTVRQLVELTPSGARDLWIAEKRHELRVENLRQRLADAQWWLRRAREKRELATDELERAVAAELDAVDAVTELTVALAKEAAVRQVIAERLGR